MIGSCIGDSFALSSLQGPGVGTYEVIISWSEHGGESDWVLFRWHIALSSVL